MSNFEDVKKTNQKMFQKKYFHGMIDEFINLLLLKLSFIDRFYRRSIEKKLSAWKVITKLPINKLFYIKSRRTEVGA